VSWDAWARRPVVEPSLYAADFARLGEQVETLLDVGATVFHWDVGDGHFVEPVTMGPIVLRAIASLVHERDGALDCHLMVDNPERHVAQFAEAGGDSVTVHVEVDWAEALRLARRHGLGAGLALNPETPVEDAVAAAAGFDLVLCMSVHPGYSGQAFIPDSLDRVRQLAESLPKGMPIQVDGGIGTQNAPALRAAGATLFVAASAIFGADDPARAYRELVETVG
jgi:ribulose-phosphate 3-epimerase